MGRGATKAAGNVYYKARIEAAKWNDRLCSREGAAEALGVSVDTVKNIELGLHKCVDPGKLEDVKRELISIAEDGEITEDEIPSLKEILDYADKLILSATELKMLGSQVMTDHEREVKAK